MKNKIYKTFKTSGIPSETYVSRNEELDLERSLSRGGVVIVISGLSKTGKTTLCKKVLSKNGKDWILFGCHNGVCVKDIWKHVLEKLKFERTEKITDKLQTTHDGKAATTINAAFVKFTAGGGAKKQNTCDSHVAKILADPGVLRV